MRFALQADKRNVDMPAPKEQTAILDLALIMGQYVKAKNLVLTRNRFLNFIVLKESSIKEVYMSSELHTFGNKDKEDLMDDITYKGK